MREDYKHTLAMKNQTHKQHRNQLRRSNIWAYGFLLALLLLSIICTAQTTTKAAAPSLSTSPVFVQNKGQLADNRGNVLSDVDYHLRISGMDVYFRTTGLSFVLNQYSKAENDFLKNSDLLLDVSKSVSQKTFRIDLTWEGSNNQTNIEAQQPVSEYFNYYYSHCPDGIHNVRGYEKLLYKNVYQGIDMVFYLKERNGSLHLEYDIVVHPGADPNQVKLNYDADGVDALFTDKAYQFKTPLGVFKESLGEIYQLNDQGERKLIDANYKKQKELVSFNVENYDESKKLIIDPFFTYYGTVSAEYGTEIVTDSKNHVVVLGSSAASGLPFTGTGYVEDFGGGFTDFFVVKLDDFGNRLWSTYYGGNSFEFPGGIDVDASDNIFFVGNTYSDNFPTSTIGVLQGSVDGALVSFDSNGARRWAQYYGGNVSENIIDIKVDNNDEIVVCGLSSSVNLPVAGCLPSSFQGGNSYGGDGFIARFSNGNGNFQWGTYVGGSEDDVLYGITVDNNNNVIVTGKTKSSDFVPVLVGTKNAEWCAIVIKYDENCAFEWGNLFGGNAGEGGVGNAIAADLNDNTLVVTGYTSRTDYPVKNGRSYISGSSSTVLTKFDKDGNMVWSTYYEGEKGNDIKIDAAGTIWFTGNISTANLSTNASAIQPTYGGGATDGFVANISADGATTLCATYYGGNGLDESNGIALDNNGNVLITGETRSTNLTGVDATSLQSNKAGSVNSSDAFIASICSNCGNTPSVDILENGPIAICAGEDVVLNANGSNIISWTTNDGTRHDPILGGNNQITIPNITDNINVEACVGAGSSGCLVCDTLSIKVEAAPTIATLPTDATICIADAPHDFSVDLNGVAPWEIKYVNQKNTTDTVAVNCAASPCNISIQDSSCYNIVKLTDAACYTEYTNQEFCLAFHDQPTGNITLATGFNNNICPGETVDLEITFAKGAPNYGFSYQKDSDPVIVIAPQANNPYTLSGLGAGTYKLTQVTDANCSQAITGQQITIIEHPLPSLTITNPEYSNPDNTIWVCEGDDAVITFDLTGNASYVIDYTYNTIAQPSLMIGSNSGSITVNAPGTYTFTNISDNFCTNVISQTIIVGHYALPTVDISTTDDNICSGDNTNLVFTLTGATPFEVSVDKNPPTPASLTGISSGGQVNISPAVTTTYNTINVTDANNCTANIEKSVTITVHTTDAGELDDTGIEVCEADNAKVTETDPVTLDEDDVVEYLLHSNNPYSNGSIIHERNTSGEFTLGTRACGTTYYITRIAGNDNGIGQVDDTDPCFKQTSTVPVSWRCTPDYIRTDLTELCVNSNDSINFTLNGSSSPFNISVNGSIISPAVSSPYKLPININDDTLIIINSIGYETAPHCYNTKSDDINIAALTSPSLVSQTETCIATNDRYNISIEITGGDLGTYAFDVISPVGLTGNLIGNTWTSSIPVNSASTYEIHFFDKNHCDTLKVFGNHTCDCVTDAGELDITAIEICEDDTVIIVETKSVTTDENDVVEYLLHDGTPYVSGNLIHARSNTGEFPIGNLNCGTTYYVTRKVGNDDGSGKVDETDACFNQTSTVPIRWRCNPFIEFDAVDFEACDSSEVTIPIKASGSETNFSYILNGTNYNIFKADTEHVVLVNATSLYKLTSVGYQSLPSCSQVMSDSITVTALGSPMLVNFYDTCMLSNDSVKVMINLSGGDVNSYDFNVLSGNVTGSFDADNPNVWIGSGKSPINYQIEFFDKNKCDTVLVTGQRTCNCTTDAGVLSVLPIVGCEAEEAQVTIEETWNNDGNDVLEFVLHEGALAAGDILKRNSTGKFNLDTLTCGKVYYISALAGNDNGSGQVNTNDACYDIAGPVEVLWRCNPTAKFDSSLIETCDNKMVTIPIHAWGSGHNFNYTVNDSTYTNVGDTSEIQVFITRDSIFNLTSVSYTDLPLCEQMVNDSITIHVLGEPQVVDYQVECDDTNEKIRVIVDLLDGDSLSYAVDSITMVGPDGSGGVFTNTTWTSDWFPSGQFYFDFSDKNQCGIATVTDSFYCDCTSDAGTIDTTSLLICGDETFTISKPINMILDGNDSLEFILHNGTDTTIGSNWVKNSIGIFDYPGVPFMYGTQYFVHAVVGNFKDNHVDELDPCFSISNGVKVQFRGLPDAVLNAVPNDSICLGDSVAIQLNIMAGIGPFSIKLNDEIFNQVGSGQLIWQKPEVTTSYKLESITDKYCSNNLNDSIRLNVPEKPIQINDSVVQMTCHDTFDGEINAFISGGFAPYTFAWTDEWGDFISNDSELLNLGPGKYKLSCIDAVGCSEEKVYTINKPPLFNIDLVNVLNEICFQNEDGQIRVVADGGAEYAIPSSGRLWQKDSIFYNMGYLPGSNKYTIHALDSNGCSTDTAINIEGLTPIEWVIEPEDKFICEGEEVSLSAELTGGNEGFTYYWNDIKSNPMITDIPIETTTYSVYGLDNNDCPSTKKSITVFLPDELELLINGPDVVCPSDSGVYYPQISGGREPYNMAWLNSVNDTLSDTVILTYQAGNSSDEITLVVNDACDSKMSLSKPVFTPNNVDVKFTPSQYSACVPANIQFENNTTINDKASSFWVINNNKTWVKNPLVIFNKSDTYLATLYVNDEFSCEYSFTDSIVINPKVTADFQFNSHELDAMNAQTTVTNYSNGASYYEWEVDSIGKIINVFEPSLNFPSEQSGVYEACLEVKNEFGCKDSICKLIKVNNDNKVFVPNFFTPNQDQLNDNFKPVLSTDKVNIYEFNVFNRWGELIFETNNPKEGWSGVYKNQEVQNNIYTWRLRVRFTDEIEIRVLTGIVTLGK